MPDTLKQFYNASINVTGLTGNQTATLFTNNSTTRAVIKDVDVANTFPVTPNLTVGGTAVASLGSNLTGSEIVDVSQAVAMSFASPLAFTMTQTVNLISSGTQRVSTSYNINGLVSGAATADQATPSLDASASYVTAVYYAPDGDVFSAQTDGNSYWLLRKNAGGAGGTASTVNSGFTGSYSAIAFDGINTFYWLTSSTNLRAFNADTETTTNTTIATVSGGGGATYSRLLFSNGYLLYSYQGTASPYLIEISTGRWAFLNGLDMSTVGWNASHVVPGFWFDTSTRVATLMWFYPGNNDYYRAISPAVPALTAASVTISTSWTTLNLDYSAFVGSGQPSVSAAHIVLYSADGGVTIDSANAYARVLSGISGATSGWSLGAAISNIVVTIYRPRVTFTSSPTVNTTNFPSTISLRLTGVEVTA